MMLILYAAAKYLAYSGWCWVGLQRASPALATASASFGLGAARWFIGLAFGVAVFLGAGSIDASAAARTYFLLYSPVRLLEWGIIAVVIVARARRRSEAPAMSWLALWVLGGIVVSFLTDVFSPDGLSGRFCVGRCLC